MITPAAPVAQPSITGFDIKIISIDCTRVPHIVNIVYFAEIGGVQSSPDQMLTLTLPQLLATPGADIRLKWNTAVANAMGLVSPTIT